MTDLSDDPANPSDLDSEGDNEADDPTGIYLAALEVTKTASGVTPASLVAGSSGAAGNFVVDFAVTTYNRGNDLINNLGLVEDLASQFGGAFAQIVGAPTFTITNNSGLASVAANPAGYNGGAISQVLNVSTSQLGPGDEVEIVIRVEVDPDAVTGLLPNGRLENSATASGMASSGQVVVDVSDDPTNATNVDPDNDNNPDDPTTISIADLAVTKSLDTIVPAASGTAGNFDVTYLFRVTNTGTESLSQLSLTDNFASQFGGAFRRVVGVSVMNIDASVAPSANSAFNGLAGSNLLLPAVSDDVRPGQSFEVSLTIEVDPDHGAANFNAAGELQNIATASAVGANGGLPASLSDDTSNPADTDTDGDGHPNDPTTLRVADMAVTKTFVSSGPATSGTAGNFDITYDLTIVNTGNDPLSELSLTDDLFSDMGLAFVGIVLQAGQPATLQGSSVADDPEFNPAFDGNAAGVGDSEIIDHTGANTNLLDVGQSVTIRIIAEIDPDAVGAIVTGGYVSNQATASAVGTAAAISQLSDDPNDATDANIAGDNDPEDATRVLVSDMTLEKAVVGSPSRQADGTWNVSFAVAYRNTGATTISNLMLFDDLSSTSNFGSSWLTTTSVNLDASGVMAGVAPGLNAAWQANPAVNVFDGTGLLEAGDEIVVNFTVNIDPDRSGSTAAGITNQAFGSGIDTTATLLSDFSDDPSNPTDVDPNGDNDPDDATIVALSDIGVAKQINTAVEVAGRTGVFDVEYALVIENTGTVDLTNIQVNEQLGGAAGHFGNGFIGVPVAPAIVASSLTPGASLPTLVSWDGVANSDFFDGSSGLLRPGDSLVVTLTVRVDTVAGDSTAPMDFNNQVTATADGPMSTVASDLSDFGTNPNGNNADGSEDTPTPLQIPQIRSSKNHAAASRNPDGSYTVPVLIAIANTGTVDMDSIQMVEDVASQFGDGFIAVQNPQVMPGAPFGGVLPTINAAWTSDTAQNVFTAAPSSLPAGQSLTFSFNAVVDPDAVDDIAMAMSNQATVEGRGPNYDGALITVDDQSGNGVAVTSGVDNDDATPLRIPEVISQKRVIGVVPSASGTSGNVDVTYSFTLTNSGTVELVSPSLVDPWALAFGAAFIAVVDVDLSDNVVTPPTTGIGGNNSYSGALGQNMLDGAGQLLPGESVAVTVTVEIDPDANPAAITGGKLTNQATGTASYDPDPFTSGDETTVDDLSDDPDDSNDVDPDADGDPDDFTALAVTSLDVTKEATSVTPSISGTPGNFDVTYLLTITNTGTQSLSNLSLTDDLATRFGGALIDVVNVSVANIDANRPPIVNPAFDGSAGSDLLLGSITDQLAASQSFQVTMIVEVDPDHPAAMTNGNGQFSNTATGGGIGQNGDLASDVSDDPTDPTDIDPNGDNNPDDATTLAIGSLRLTKLAGPIAPAASGSDGNFDVTYTFTLQNTGNDDISALAITDDWASELGGAFVRVVDQNLSNDVAGSVTVAGNPTYAGGAAENLFAAGSLLGSGETVTVAVTVELDPDASTANLIGGQLLNSATAQGMSTLGLVNDLSDDPSDTTNVDVDGDNTPDDRTGISVADMALTKSVLGLPVPAASGTTGNYDVTLIFRISNTGSETLSNLTLTDDLANQFGGAFVAVRNIALSNIDASVPPSVNSGFDGTASSDMLLGSAADELQSGQSFSVTLTIEIDPNNPTGVFTALGALRNSAAAGGTGELGSLASDVSDDPTIATNVDPDGDNNPDDPTLLRVADLNATKIVGIADPANQVVGSTGAFGNFVVPYTISIANTGNDLITSLSVIEDLASQFGGGLVGIVGSPSLTLTNNSGLAVATPNPSAFDGNATTEILDTTVSRLGIGDQLIVTLQVEIDPDNPAATMVAGALENTAIASGTDSSGNSVSDISDDPADPTSDHDPTRIAIPALSVAKLLGSVLPAASGTTGNFDVSYTLTFANTGTEVLSNLSLRDDLVSQFGGAFVDVLSVVVNNVNATTAPLPNLAFDGTATSDLLMGAVTDAVEPGQSFQVQLTIEVDPDHPAGNFVGAGDLANYAVGQGSGSTGSASGLSDNPADVTNADEDADGQPDDPTTVRIGDLALEKTIGNVNPASTVVGSTGDFGNFVVDYTLTVRNTGNDLLTSLTLVENFASHFGGAFVGIVGAPSLMVTNNSGLAAANANPAGFNGNSVAEMLDIATSQLGRGDEVAVTIRVELDPDAATANLIGDALQNSAVAGGMDSAGNPVSDLSDDPANLTSDDDPTPFRIADLAVTKATAGVVPATSGTVGNYDVTYTFTFANTGTETLSNLSLVDDLAGQLGGALVGVVSVNVTNVDANTPPAANGAYDGTGSSDLLSGAATDRLLPGESFTVTLVVELNPDSATGTFNAAGQLENSATGTATGATGSTSSVSDDPTDGTNEDEDADGQPDDETTLAIGDLSVEKVAIVTNPANQVTGSTGTPDNFVITYAITVRNTGNSLLDGLRIEENLAAAFGGAFVAVVGTPTIGVTNLSGTSAANANTVPYDGDTITQVLDATTSRLGIGDTIDVTIQVEVDPDDPTATLVMGGLVNRATVSGTDANGDVLSNLSDDPSDATNIDVDGDNDPDDATSVLIADLSVSKSLGTIVPAASGASGNRDVTYVLTVMNTGTTSLQDLRLTDNLAGQFGGAFVGVVNVMVSPGTATAAPMANGAFDGALASNLLLPSPSTQLDVGQSFQVTLIVEIDPDNVGARYNASGDLANSATATAAGPFGMISSDSDDPSNPADVDADNDGSPDDETALSIADIQLTKAITNAMPALSGTLGNIDVTYTFVLTNTGNQLLTNLRILDDWAGQFGGAFIGVVDTDLSNGNVVAPGGSGIGGNASYLGGSTENLLNGLGSLAAGQSVTVTVIVELDPDAATATLNAAGRLENTADATANGVFGLISDVSDDPANPADVDTEGDNDPDDGTVLSVSSIRATKAVAGVAPSASGTPGNFDVAYEFTVTNYGLVALANLNLTDDLATQMGGAFVGVVGVNVTNVNASGPPVANPAFDGTLGSDMLLGSAADDLRPGQSFVVTLVIEIDPDHVAAIYDVGGDLANTGEVSALGPDGLTSSQTDNPNDPTDADRDADGNPDDPTTLQIAHLAVEKTQVGSPVAAVSGSEDHIDVTYDISIFNTGNTALTQLSLLEDLQLQMLGGFVRIVGSPTIVAGMATDLPEFNTGFDGGITVAEMFDNVMPNANRLDRGQSLTIRLVAELDPAAASGPIANQALVTGTNPGDPLNPVSDPSDDPTDSTNVDPDNDNDPDDATGLRYPDISAAKSQLGIPTQSLSDPSLYEVTYEIVLQNSGNLVLAGLDLYDDLAVQLGGGFVGVSAGPNISSHTLANAANLPTINGGWPADTSLSLFNDDGQLLPGESLTVQLTATVDPALVMSGTNQAVATADNPLNGTEDGVTDASDSGTNPVSTNPGAPGDTGSASDATPLFLPDATVGLAKAATVLGDTVTLRFGLANTGNLLASHVQVADNLNATFGAGTYVVNSISLTTPPGDVDSTLTINPGYNGATDTNLLNGSMSNTLDVGDTAVISVEITINELVDVDGGGPLSLGEYLNTARATSTDAVGNLFADDSVSGLDPDPDRDGNATNNAGPTSIFVAVDATVGVAKDSVWNDANDTVAYTLVIENFGNTRATNLSVVDDLDAVFGAGNYSVSGLSVAAGPATVTVNAGFNGAGNQELLGVGSLLGVGESAELRFAVTVFEIADPQANGLGYYENSVTALSEDSDGTVYTDASTDGTDPDPDMDGDPTNNASPDSGNLTPEATVGAAKTATVSFAPTIVTIDVYLEHFGNTNAAQLDVREDLEAVFGAGTYTVSSLSIVAGPATLATNGSFDGSGDKDLIAAGSSLRPGETGHIRLVLGLTLTAGVYNNQVFVTSTDTDGTTYLDDSVLGIDPDPDGSQSPNNDSSPTPILLGNGTIAGLTYIDTNNNGIVDAIEVGIPGVTMQLDGIDQNGTSFTRMTTTGAGGVYSFTGLPMGEYVIRQLQPSAYIDGVETAGNFGGDTSVNDQIAVSLVAFGPQFVATGYNFAEVGVDPFGGGKDPFLGSQQPVIIVSGDTLFVTGTTGDDDVQIAPGRSQHVIRFNAGTYTYDVQSIRNIRVSGNGGHDRVEMLGAVGADRVVLLPNSAQMTHASYEVRLTDVDHIIARGDAGVDTAFLVDSAASDVFVAGSSYAVMRDLNNVYKNETFGFEIVTGNAVMGGNDVATLYDGSGNDQVRFVGEFGQMIGTGAELRASKFESLTVRRSVGGADSIEVVDSPGDDELTMYPRSAVMRGASFRNRVEGFAEIRAVASKGGFDTAAFYDGTGDDVYRSWSDFALMEGETYRNTASGFEVTSGYAVAGGYDTAELHDGSGNDVLVARGTYTELRGTGFKQRALGFDSVDAVANRGGYDTALLFDTAGDDLFTNDNTIASLWGTGYENVAIGFEQVQAQSEMGGHDTAEFAGVTARQLLTGRGSMAKVTGAGRNALATGFAAVRAIASPEETAHADVVDVDYVFSQLGSWG